MSAGIAGFMKYSTSVLAIATLASGLGGIVWVISGLKAEIDMVKRVGDEKFKTIEEKIRASKIEAVNESTENFLKYNHSEEYVGLRKTNK